MKPNLKLRLFVAGGGSRIACAAVALIASLTLVGWMIDWPLLTKLMRDSVSMNPATAVVFFLAASALWLIRDPQLPVQGHHFARCCAVLVIFLGVARLAGYAMGLDITPDAILLADRLQGNRMAPNTALLFIMLGVALMLISSPRGDSLRLSQFLAAVVAVGAMLPLAGYAYGAGPLFAMWDFFPMAFNTAGCFLLLSAGTLLARPGEGLLRVFFSNGPGGTMASWLLPSTIILPFILGWVRVDGERAGIYSPEIGAALMAVACMASLVTIVWWTAIRIDRGASERDRIEKRLRDAYTRYSDLYDNAPCGYYSVDAEGRFLDINHTLLEWLGYRREQVIDQIGLPEILTEHSRTLFRKYFPELMRVGMVKDLQIEVLRKDGSSFPALLNASAISDSQGNFIASRSMLVDITELERARQMICALNLRLEQHVNERARELQEVQQQLTELLAERPALNHPKSGSRRGAEVSSA